MKPKLRQLEISPTEEGYSLHDPLGLSEQGLVLSQEALYIASLFDGEHDLLAVQTTVFNQQGQLLPREKIEELVEALGAAGFLEDEGFAERLKNLEREFIHSGHRPMQLAGVSYPAQPEMARAFLGAFRALHDPSKARSAQALLLPHLEPSRVPEVYGAALEVLHRTPPPQRVLLVGVAHRPLAEPAAALPVSFETPFGLVQPDLEALSALDALLPFELFNSPLAFRQEHSLELPLFFLKGAWPGYDFKLLPLLVSGEAPALGEAIKLIAQEYPLLPVLSVDLSHVGPRFGDQPVDRNLVHQAQGADQSYLEALAQGAFNRAFFQHRRNPTRIDALYSALALSKLLEGKTGQVLAYKLDLEAPTLSAVGAGVVVW